MRYLPGERLRGARARGEKALVVEEINLAASHGTATGHNNAISSVTWIYTTNEPEKGCKNKAQRRPRISSRKRLRADNNTREDSKQEKALRRVFDFQFKSKQFTSKDKGPEVWVWTQNSTTMEGPEARGAHGKPLFGRVMQLDTILRESSFDSSLGHTTSEVEPAFYLTAFNIFKLYLDRDLNHKFLLKCPMRRRESSFDSSLDHGREIDQFFSAIFYLEPNPNLIFFILSNTLEQISRYCWGFLLVI
ncbi:hypothetical protein K438DRAFT_1752486 [Mycena galopus ATCC 62051]|nr:hypothetical protein K438DRAFT_1752486 [Mycena galopus ATCC 62051]